jgi:hypothetical protein
MRCELRRGLGCEQKWFKAVMMKNNHFVVTTKQQIEVKIFTHTRWGERRCGDEGEMVLGKINNFFPVPSSSSSFVRRHLIEVSEWEEECRPH